MGGTDMKRRLMTWIAVGAVALLASTGGASAKPFRIAVSNSYIGNEWRVEMINFMQAYAAKNLKDKVDADGQQFRHRRAEADRSHLRHDLGRRRRDHDQSGIGHRARCDHRGGLQAEHPGRLVRPGRDRAMRLQHRRRLS